VVPCLPAPALPARTAHAALFGGKLLVTAFALVVSPVDETSWWTRQKIAFELIEMNQ
jgi:hypothetical protein